MKGLTERAQELIVDRVTEGLDLASDRELNSLLPQCPELDTESFELAAAAITLACLPLDEPIPSGVHDRLMQSARRSFQDQ